jgi:hypothetical protein
MAGGCSLHHLCEGCYHAQLYRKLTRKLFVLPLKLENIIAELKARDDKKTQ